jgi:hypothetical protein
MKLGKLLGAGKSFFGGQGTVTYRENKQVYLPKFNPGGSPFTPKKADLEEAVTPPVAPVEAKPSVKAPAPAPVPVAASAVREPNWTEKLNPFRNAKAAKAVPTAPMPNVQPEFTLGTVKVIHNDLSDADVEVVPMKSRSASPAPAAAASEAASMEFLGEPVMKSI